MIMATYYCSKCGLTKMLPLLKFNERYYCSECERVEMRKSLKHSSLVRDEAEPDTFQDMKDCLIYGS